MIIYRLLLIMAVVVFTTSCAFLFDKKVSTAVQPYQPPKVIEVNFSYSGRFVITTAADTYYGNFSWLKNGLQQQLELRSILGTTVARVDITEQYNSLQFKDKIYRQEFLPKPGVMSSIDDNHYGNLTRLLEDYLGFDIPLQYMHYWVQGVPLPRYNVDQFLADGFMQQGWKVEYLQYKNGKPVITRITKGSVMIKLLLT